MDNQKNIIAAISLSAAVIILYSLFFVEPVPDQRKLENKNKENTELTSNAEAPKIDEVEEIKKISREDSVASDDRIYFENNYVKGSISLSKGGAIDDFEFKEYNKTLGSEEKIILLSPANINSGYIFNSGWVTSSDIEVPNSKTVWKTDNKSKLTPGNSIKMYFENNQGVLFERTISLDEKYLFNIDQKIINNSDKTYKFYPYSFLHRNSLPEDLTDFYILHEGYTLMLNDELEEIDYKDVKEEKFTREASTGYLVIGDKYWMTSILPPQGRKFRFDLDYKNKYRSSYIDLDGYEVGPNSTVQHKTQSLIGAKEIALIDDYEETLQINKLDLIVNYGVMYFIVRPMWVVLDFLFKFTGNYGYSILLITLMVRIVFFPLNQYSMKSMGRMKKIAPEIENLKAQFKTDKQQLQREMMKLYKARGINPASSCLPILLQIPIFFSLYKLLLLDIGMYHSKWLWIWQDLSAKDPLSIFNLFGLLPFEVPGFLEIGLLPCIMGITMALQMRLSPQPAGNDEMQKMQRTIFKFFPILITVILAPFPSGLILYWCATNVLTILQQWVINRNLNISKN